MDAFEVRLCEEVRRYRHLYDSSCKDYKNVQVTHSAWREIALTLGKDEAKCLNKWKYLRDRFVKTKRIKGRGGATGNGSAMTLIYSALDWLSDFVKHRATPSNLTALEERDTHVGTNGVSLTGKPCRAHLPIIQKATCQPPPHHRAPPRFMTACRADAAHGEPIGDAIQTRLERLDRIGEQREDACQEANFAQMVVDMLRKFPPQQRSQAKFEIHQLLFQMEQVLYESQAGTGTLKKESHR